MIRPGACGSGHLGALVLAPSAWRLMLGRMSVAPQHPAARPQRTPAAVKAGAVVALLVVLLGGAYLILNFGPTGTLFGIDYVVLIVVVWFVVVSAVVGKITSPRKDLGLPLRVAFLAVAIAGSGFYVWDTYLRPKKETNENIVQVPSAAAPAPDAPAGEPDGGTAPAPSADKLLGSGDFEGVDGHDAAGKASLIELADGGQVLTFDKFEVTQGPDLRVYLVRGDSVSGDNFIDLGELKAEKGRFQYELDKDIDPGEYTHVFVWCRAFSTGFGRAPLAGS